jgi:phosphatidylserine decarboxylase
MHWFSRIESPPVPAVSIAIWRLFDRDLDLSEARERRFKSLNACFTRRLRYGVRPVDARPDVIVSPCDAIVGAFGSLRGTEAIQAKGFSYSLEELLVDRDLAQAHRDGVFVTLRLKGSMYHRFHAPCDGELREVTHVPGDAWNVNPAAVQRVERLYCKNERAVLPLATSIEDLRITLVPVAAVLVASLRLHALDHVLDLRYRGPQRLECASRFAKGEELGWFEQGSTILVFAAGAVELCDGIESGKRIRMGEALLRRLPDQEIRPDTRGIEPALLV